MNILPPGQHATVRQLWAALIVVAGGWFGFRVAFIVDCRMAGGGLMVCWQTEPLLPSPKDAGLIAAASAVLTTGLGALLLFFAEVPLKIQANWDARETNAAQIKWILGELERVRTEIRNHHHGR